MKHIKALKSDKPHPISYLRGLGYFDNFNHGGHVLIWNTRNPVFMNISKLFKEESIDY